MSDLIEIGALWSHRSGKGASGKLGKGRIVLLPNDKRGNDRAPDWRLFIAPDNREQDQQGSGDQRRPSDPPDDVPW